MVEMEEEVELTKEAKPVAKSSQVWGNFGIAALVMAIPQVREFAMDHPQIWTSAMAVVNILWRVFITKKPIEGIF